MTKGLFSYIAIVLILSAVTLLIVWEGAMTHWLPQSGMGEALAANHYVTNYRLYGMKYGLLEDLATGQSEASHPYLYTHNVNMGGLFFVLLDNFGFRSLAAKQVLTILAFLLGMLASFYVIRTITGSYLLGSLNVLFLSCDYLYSVSFALNSLRAWSYLGIYLTILFAYFLARRYSGSTNLPLWKILTGCFAASLITFGLGYDFWICTIFIGAISILAFWRAKFDVWKIFQAFLLYGTTLSIAPLLRQAQIIWALGFRFWSKDLYYSAVIKLNVASKIFPLPALSTIDQFYHDHGVVRAPASPSQSVSQILSTAAQMLLHVALPTIGLVTAVIIIGGIVLCAAVIIRESVHSETKRSWLNDSAKLALVQTIGIMCGLAFFAPLTLHIYLSHKFPLIIVPIALLKAIVCLYLLRTCARFALRGQSFRSSICALLLMFIAVDFIIIQRTNCRNLYRIPVGVISFVEQHLQASYVVPYTADLATAFSTNWAFALKPGLESGVLNKINTGDIPFETDDYIVFGQRDSSSKGDLYRKPNYWIYFPTDAITEFDSPTAKNHWDYASKFIFTQIDKLCHPKLEQSWTHAPLKPDSENKVFWAGVIKNSDAVNEVFAIQGNERLPSQLVLNQIYGYLHGYVSVPSGKSGVFSIEVKVRGGRCYKIANVSYSLTASNHYGPSDYSFRPPELSVNDILAGLKDKSRAALVTDQFVVIRCD
jgi:hypothetical protein